MEKSDWLLSIKAKRRRKTVQALIFVVGAEALWLGLVAVGVWGWVNVFHRFPPGRLVLDVMVALGTAVVIPLAAIAPLAPMRGKDPEVIAADEFFKGPPS